MLTWGQRVAETAGGRDSGYRGKLRTRRADACSADSWSIAQQLNDPEVPRQLISRIMGASSRPTLQSGGLLGEI